jgi:hypothetical protein
MGTCQLSSKLLLIRRYIYESDLSILIQQQFSNIQQAGAWALERERRTRKK